MVNNPPTHAGDVGSIPGLGRSPGEGNGYSLQYSCLENPMDRGAWRATAHGVTKSLTRLSTHAGAHSGTCTQVSLERLQMLSSIESLNRGFLLKSPILPTPTHLTLLVEEDFSLEMKRDQLGFKRKEAGKHPTSS